MYVLAVSGSTVYTGGTFTSVGGQTRHNLAALDASTGNATTWNPNATACSCGGNVPVVDALAASGSTVYAGGSFTTIGSLPQQGIAKFGQATSPKAAATTATSVTATGATLNGTVNANGSNTSYHFQWGTSTSYQHATASTPAGWGTTAFPFSHALTGLAPETTYHFRVVATNDAGNSSGADHTFTTASAVPSVTSISPRGGPNAGGNTVTINGTNFLASATVKFGATPASSVTFVSPTQLTTKAPARPAGGTIHVTVHNPSAASAATNADLYAYGPPTIALLNPTGGPTAGGNTVTITGTGFVPGATVKFGATASATVTFVSVTQLTAKAPAHTGGSVRILVTTPAGTSAATNADLYAYGPPTIALLNPTGGPTAGGNTVTIKGTGFVPGATVKFGATPSATVTFVSVTQLTAKAPAHTGGSVRILVTTPAGASARPTPTCTPMAYRRHEIPPRKPQ